MVVLLKYFGARFNFSRRDLKLVLVCEYIFVSGKEVAFVSVSISSSPSVLAVLSQIVG